MSPTKASPVVSLNWPLMNDHVTDGDFKALVDFLGAKPVLTQSKKVRQFEEAWSRWLGVRHSVFVNSGSSANFITMRALHEKLGPGQVIVPTLTWVSDIASVIAAGFEPIFVDIDPKSLGMSEAQVLAKLTPTTKAVFITHILGLNALSERLVDELARREILLIEDVCESPGANLGGRKAGTIGQISNFSFYFAHHATTIEGGMISTNDDRLYEAARLFRSHGMVREADSAVLKKSYADQYPDLHPEFIFAYGGFNMRSTEINAVLGLEQLKRLDADIEARNANFHIFIKALDPDRYRTDLRIDGMSNYALILILKHEDDALLSRVIRGLREANVEFRRGASGGGNQLRQPYLRRAFADIRPEDYPEVEHVHRYGFYIGNFPGLEHTKIKRLAQLLNTV